MNEHFVRARNILKNSRGLGVTIPPAIADVEATVETSVKRLEDLTRENLTEAAVAAVSKDKPLDDKRLRAAVVAAVLQTTGAAKDAADTLGQPLVRALVESADELVRCWAVVHDEAVATLQAAAEHIGGVALDDTAAVLAKGGDAAAHWNTARGAVATIEKVRQVYRMYCSWSGYIDPEPDYRQLMVARLTFEQWQQASGSEVDPWYLISAGIAPRLATADEYEKNLDEIRGAIAANVEDALLRNTNPTAWAAKHQQEGAKA